VEDGAVGAILFQICYNSKMFLEKYEIFEPNEKKLKNLEKKYSPFLAKLLLARGIENEKEAETFLDIS
jgi:hypothetical protein